MDSSSEDFVPHEVEELRLEIERKQALIHYYSNEKKSFLNKMKHLDGFFVNSTDQQRVYSDKKILKVLLQCLDATGRCDETSWASLPEALFKLLVEVLNFTNFQAAAKRKREISRLQEQSVREKESAVAVAANSIESQVSHTLNRNWQSKLDEALELERERQNSVLQEERNHWQQQLEEALVQANAAQEVAIEQAVNEAVEGTTNHVTQKLNRLHREEINVLNLDWEKKLDDAKRALEALHRQREQKLHRIVASTAEKLRLLEEKEKVVLKRSASVVPPSNSFSLLATSPPPPPPRPSVDVIAKALGQPNEKHHAGIAVQNQNANLKEVREDSNLENLTEEQDSKTVLEKMCIAKHALQMQLNLVADERSMEKSQPATSELAPSPVTIEQNNVPSTSAELANSVHENSAVKEDGVVVLKPDTQTESPQTKCEGDQVQNKRGLVRQMTSRMKLKMTRVARIPRVTRSQGKHPSKSQEPNLDEKPDRSLKLRVSKLSSRLFKGRSKEHVEYNKHNTTAEIDVDHNENGPTSPAKASNEEKQTVKPDCADQVAVDVSDDSNENERRIADALDTQRMINALKSPELQLSNGRTLSAGASNLEVQEDGNGDSVEDENQGQDAWNMLNDLQESDSSQSLVNVDDTSAETTSEDCGESASSTSSEVEEMLPAVISEGLNKSTTRGVETSSTERVESIPIGTPSVTEDATFATAQVCGSMSMNTNESSTALEDSSSIGKVPTSPNAGVLDETEVMDVQANDRDSEAEMESDDVEEVNRDIDLHVPELRLKENGNVNSDVPESGLQVEEEEEQNVNSDIPESGLQVEEEEEQNVNSDIPESGLQVEEEEEQNANSDIPESGLHVEEEEEKNVNSDIPESGLQFEEEEEQNVNSDTDAHESKSQIDHSVEHGDGKHGIVLNKTEVENKEDTLKVGNDKCAHSTFSSEESENKLSREASQGIQETFAESTEVTGLPVSHACITAESPQENSESQSKCKILEADDAQGLHITTEEQRDAEVGNISLSESQSPAKRENNLFLGSFNPHQQDTLYSSEDEQLGDSSEDEEKEAGDMCLENDKSIYIADIQVPYPRRVRSDSTVKAHVAVMNDSLQCSESLDKLSSPGLPNRELEYSPRSNRDLEYSPRSNRDYASSDSSGVEELVDSSMDGSAFGDDQLTTVDEGLATRTPKSPVHTNTIAPVLHPRQIKSPRANTSTNIASA